MSFGRCASKMLPTEERRGVTFDLDLVAGTAGTEDQFELFGVVHVVVGAGDDYPVADVPGARVVREYEDDIVENCAKIVIFSLNLIQHRNLLKYQILCTVRED